MSDVRKTDEPIVAILVADLHLSHKAPIWRSAEPNWYAAMARPLTEIRGLSERHGCSVICAGDIFDKWNVPPELINFALGNLPDKMICIPGQHDLPNHVMNDIGKSAYWTLVESKKILHVAGRIKDDGPLRIKGHCYGESLTKNQWSRDDMLGVAVLHEYKWLNKNNAYMTALPSAQFRERLKESRIKEWDVIVYGDNHIPWNVRKGDTRVWNCGAIMRRHRDDTFIPRVGLLHSNGMIHSHPLDISHDKYIRDSELPSTGSKAPDVDIQTIIQSLESLGESAFDLHRSIKEYLQQNKVSQGTKEALTDIMERSAG